MFTPCPTERSRVIADRVERFVRDVVVPYEADRCVQILGGMGVSRDTIVEQILREVRAFRIYDGPTEVHKWSLARKIKRDTLAGTPAR